MKTFMFKGDRESACLAVVRHTKDILASSNLKDIAQYCKMHSIEYLTKMTDILHNSSSAEIFDVKMLVSQSGNF